ncbi:MAG: Alkaline phosphatase synthesis sensor protein PhoR [Firmicutes bacterium ADurb.Bin300]|nr:MAG: Alkaline phosphatase synthesis sensor protein PhoR [Firmicutes bacterium ADurb.Bin300]
MKLRGISKRWVLNSLVITALLFLLLAAIILSVTRAYYNNYVYNFLVSNANDNVSAFFRPYLSGTEDSFKSAAKQFIENFENKGHIDVWVFDKYGNVIATTTGFPVELTAFDLSDMTQATKSDTGIAHWTGRNSNGESIMSVSMVFPGSDSTFKGGVRFISSLEEVNRRLIVTSLIIILALIVSLLLVYLSGMFFIQSIVRPVQRISEIASRIAKGDMNVEIEAKGDDEIGELSSAINNMIKELKASEKLKNDFISTVSHELRTPLTAIKGWGETLLDISDNDKELTKRGISVIIRESDRLSQLLEELLDFSRMQTGSLSLRFEKMDVLAELDEAVYVFKERAKREGMELNYAVTDLPSPINGDPDRIKQVFVNILDNAIKYSSQGGIINVSADVNGNLLSVCVSDNGCGIAPEDLPRVTEKFFKANISVRGSGIGLAVCDEIIRRHGGTITFESELGSGTSVTVTLPILPAAYTAEERSQPNE